MAKITSKGLLPPLLRLECGSGGRDDEGRIPGFYLLAPLQWIMFMKKYIVIWGSQTRRNIILFISLTQKELLKQVCRNW